MSSADPATFQPTIDRLRTTVTAGHTTVTWRLRMLKQLKRMLVECESDFAAALESDLGKHAVESALTEMGVVLGEVNYLMRRVRAAALRRPAAVPSLLQPARAWTVREPYGTVLIISPWNYPVNLTLAPLAGALAAGNTALIKPSESAPATSSLLARLIPRYFDSEAVQVIEGDKDTTSALLEHRWDMIVFTGGATVGKIVARAAAEHLTPVVLELGGKSPVWVDDTVDLAVAARRIMWGKLMNAGQTCVAPDYLLCTPQVAAELVPLLRQAVTELYGEDPQQSPDYGRAISPAHAAKLRELAGLGPSPADDPTYVPPTIVTGAATEPLMQDEIFGPILPVIEVDAPDAVADAISYITAREKPLALYVFSQDEGTRGRFERETSSGALSFGVTNAHLIVPSLPFGGVGGSGYGNYHGRWSLDTFSHRKAVLSKPLSPDTLAPGYPPFRRLGHALARLQMRG